jgi:hypothetical protein
LISSRPEILSVGLNVGHNTPEVDYPTISRVNGAVERTNLEPEQLPSILEELEEWGAYLKHQPEVINKLREFENAASNKEPSEPVEAPRPVHTRGPTL